MVIHKGVSALIGKNVRFPYCTENQLVNGHSIRTKKLKLR